VDFVRALDEVATFLARQEHRFAVAGGVALAAYGHPRLTLDLDIVTDAAAQPALVTFLETEGYRTLFRSTGFSNHRHPDRRRGRIDIVYVQGTTADRLFGGLRALPGPGGRTIPVPRPEHLIAMKVQAMKNAPERTWQEMVDIGYLLTLETCDRDAVRQYFERAGLMERWREFDPRR
jgi:hypothetical protein